MKVAVLIINMGGPDSLDAVEDYLYKIFEDPNIIGIPLPEFLRRPLARWLARKRAPKSRGIYRKLGGKTPLMEITNRQAEALEDALNQTQIAEFRVFPAMRYWHPFIREVWQQIEHDHFGRIFVLSLYPFYSTVNSASIWNEVQTLLKQSRFLAQEVTFIDRFGTHPAFIAAMKEQIAEAIPVESVKEPVHLLFSAHSLPLRRIKKGDPYFDEVKQALDLLQEEFPPQSIRFHLAFQGKVGLIDWLRPSTQEKIESIANQGVKRLYVYPLGFVADNLETLYEIGTLYAELAREKGISEFIRIDALNTRPAFIQALKQVVLDHYQQCFQKGTLGKGG